VNETTSQDWSAVCTRRLGSRSKAGIIELQLVDTASNSPGMPTLEEDASLAYQWVYKYCRTYPSKFSKYQKAESCICVHVRGRAPTHHGRLSLGAHVLLLRLSRI
jgi:hypothetical protein